MLFHRRVTPSVKFAGTHLYTWVERVTVRVNCLAQEHNAMSPARSRNRTARSGDERTNHEATAPPLSIMYHTNAQFLVTTFYIANYHNNNATLETVETTFILGLSF